MSASSAVCGAAVGVDLLTVCKRDCVMLETRIQLYQGLIRYINILSCLAAFFGSLYFSTAMPFIRSHYGLLYTNEHLLYFCTASIVSIVFTHLFYFTAASKYEIFYYVPSILKQITSSLVILLIDCLFFVIYQFLFLLDTFSILFYISYCIIALVCIIASRTVLTTLISIYIILFNKQLNLLIVGTNQRALDYHGFLSDNALLGFNVLGFLDDGDFSNHDLPLIGNLSDFDRVLRENIIDRCVVFLPIRSSYDRIMGILDRAQNQGIAVQLMSNMFQSKYCYVSPSIMGDFFGILYDFLPLGDWRLTVKRLFDIALALGLLLATLPLTIVVVVLIKLNDGGPVFFSQARIGYRKRPFRMYKFRSMVIGAEALQQTLETRNEMSGPVFKIKADPRVTPIGRLIRKYSIDELPQLVNVLLGDMSIVGPRPMARRDYAGFSQDWLRRRFSVRPGLTCSWQIQANRNDLPFQEWMQLDMAYIDSWSLTEDLKICLKTVLVVLSGDGR